MKTQKNQFRNSELLLPKRAQNKPKTKNKTQEGVERKFIWAIAKDFNFLQHGRRVNIITKKLLLILKQCSFSLHPHIVSSKLSLLGSLPACCSVAPQRQWAWTQEGLLAHAQHWENTVHSFQDKICQIWTGSCRATWRPLYGDLYSWGGRVSLLKHCTEPTWM